MGIPSGMELFVVVAVIVLLFGGKKIPELAKGLGSGIKNFKKAMREDDEEPSKPIESKEETTQVKADESQKA